MSITWHTQPVLFMISTTDVNCMPSAAQLSRHSLRRAGGSGPITALLTSLHPNRPMASAAMAIPRIVIARCYHGAGAPPLQPP